MSSYFQALNISSDSTASVASSLQTSLASVTQLYLNVRGFHWNVQGPEFFELHHSLEELYNYLDTVRDELAERISTLGVVPLHDMESYLSHSQVAPQKNISSGAKVCAAVVQGLGEFTATVLAAHQKSEACGDLGSANLLEDYVTKSQKYMWLFDKYNENPGKSGDVLS